MAMGMRRWLLLVSLAVVALPAAAEEMRLPAGLQAALFKKIFAYDKNLEARDAWSVLVVHSGSPSAAEELIKGFDDVGIEASAVEASDLVARIQGAGVVYVLPGVGAASVKQLCSDNAVLSVSGLASLAEAGEVAIGLGEEGGKPRIVVNLSRAKMENHTFSSDLLKLATVIR
jgi:hypothetical protein